MIDLYCERLVPGMWAEPLNAISNAGFLLGAWTARRHARRQGIAGRDSALLVGLMASIGVGSTLFHTFATPWALALDVLPILCFQMAFLWLYLRRVVGLGRLHSSVSVAGFLAVTLVARQFPAVLNGSLSYAPALAAVVGLGVYHVRTQEKEAL